MRIAKALAATHRGRRMPHNEDGILQIPDVPLYAIVDGTGGERPAEVALEVLRQNTRALYEKIQQVAHDAKSSSRLAVGRFFEGVFHEAGRAIKRAAEADANSRYGSTMLAATVVDRFAYLAHVGDSRAYLLRDDELWILTTDHTVAMAALVRGDFTQEEYDASPFTKTLTQALGYSARLDVEFAEIWLAPGDRLLLCSDGLWRSVPDQAICETLGQADLQGAVKTLVKQALEAGGPDNVSVVVMDIAGEDEPASTADIAETLREVFLFKELTEPDRMVIAPYLEEVYFEAGEAICVEGEVGDSFYVVIDGDVRVTRGTTFLTDIGPGGQFGELTLVGPGRRTATVTATRRTRLFELSRERFLQVIRSKPGMAARLLLPLLERVGGRLADVTDRLAELEDKHGPRS